MFRCPTPPSRTPRPDRRRPWIPLSALVTLLGAWPAHADTLVTIDFPGATLTKASGINDAGTVVGLINDSSGATRGFVRAANGTFSSPIVSPHDNQNFTRALGVNNAGTVVGDDLNQTGNLTAYQGYRLNGTTFTPFDVGGPFSTNVAGINNAGDFVGSYGSDIAPNEAFVVIGGTLTEFNGPAGNTNTQATGINAADVAVGEYSDSGGTNHGFRRDPSTGVLTTIDVPGAIGTIAFGINDAGTIVGFYADTNGVNHGFFDKAGVFTTFDVPGAQSTTIRGINNLGAFVGVYVDSGGHTHGYLDTPTPTTHLLWSNTDGKAAFWNVDAAGNPTVAGTYGPFTDGSSLWHATAMATGPDGISHLLWNNPDGHVALWSVTSSGSVTGVTPFGPYTDGAAQNLWRVSGVSVGPDNVIHLLWTNTDHKAAFWNVTPSGSASALAGYGPFFDGSSPWDAVGVSTGPDNVSHLLWRNADGHDAFWNVSDGDGSATALAGYGPYTDGAASNLWGAAGVSTGPDNVSHLLWDNADGKAAFWSVSDANGSIGSVTGYGPFTDGSANALWSATALTTGPDNVSHLLWNNPDGKAALWTLGASGSATSVTGFGPFTDGSASNLWSAVAVSVGP